MTPMNVVLGIVQIVVVFGLAVLLPRFLVSRVEQAARGQVDESVGKALAEYNHTLELGLEGHKSTLTTELEGFRQSLALDRERYSRDYALFATRRNDVYAEAFGALQKAIGGYASHFATLVFRREYTNSAETDLRNLAERLELVTAAERENFIAMLDAGHLQGARDFATTLFERDQVRQAQIGFRDFKRLWVLNALYFSPEVDDALRESVLHLAVLSTYADDLIAERRIDRVKAEEALQKVDATNTKLRMLMRGEIQAGFATSGANE